MADRHATPNHGAGEGEAARTVLRIAQELVAELHPGRAQTRPVTLDSALERELGLDSLTRVELLARIERHFDVALPERVFASADTPRDLLRAVLGARGRTSAHMATDVMPMARETGRGRPDSARTLNEVLDWHLEAHPDQVHVRFDDDAGTGHVLTYRGLHEGAAAVAGGLQDFGLHPGDAVIIMLPTGADYLCSFFGILLAGGVPVPIYPPARLSQIEDHLRRHRSIVANSLATVLITLAEAKHVAQMLKFQVASLRRIVTVEELSARHGQPALPSIDPDSVAFLQYTSGSTGTPKGVVLTHANLLSNIRTMGQAIQAGTDDTFVSWLPLYHDMGLIGAWLGSLCFGLSVVLLNPLAFITHPQRWLQAMHRYRGTLSASPNFGYELCLRKIRDEDIEGIDLSHWRVAFNGAEPVSAQTLERFSERFARFGFRREALLPVYGLAECAVGLTFPPLGRAPRVARIQREPLARSGQAVPAVPDDTHALSIVSCGLPLPGYQVRIVDESSRELPENMEGRLQFRGPSATSGYYRSPAQNRELFDGDWLNSGDLAFLAAGELYVTGRSKDLIIRAGRNIYPQELEEAVGELTGVRKGCVAAIGSPELASGTERLVVLAETRESDAATRDELRAKIIAVTTDIVGTPPDDVLLLPPHSIPKTSSGKLRRAASKELYEHGRLGGPPRAVWWQFTRLAWSSLRPQLRRARQRLTAGVYALYAWLLFGLLAPVVWSAVALLPTRAWRWRAMHLGARLLAWASGTRLQIEGREQLPMPTQSCVMVANHAGYLDGYALCAALPRPVSFVAKAEFQTQFFARILLRRVGAVFVERFDTQRGLEDARHAAAAAGAGRSLLFFPEGTFTRVPGLLGFHMGAFIAAAEAGVPVVPIAIRGTRSILRDGSWFPRHGTITINVGPALDPRSHAAQTGGDVWNTALWLRTQARTHILKHCGEPDLDRGSP